MSTQIYGDFPLLVQTEGDFDGNDGGHDFAIGSGSRLELPALDRFNGLFFETQTGSLHNGDVGGASVRRDGHLEDNGALIFGFARLIRILRNRAVETDGHSDAV